MSLRLFPVCNNATRLPTAVRWRPCKTKGKTQRASCRAGRHARWPRSHGYFRPNRRLSRR